MEKIILMRWNPAISSYKLDVYHSNCEEFPGGFRIDWSVWDYEEARTGDCFVMMRVGEYKPGIVFYGVLGSDPYADKDWAGSDRMRQYVLMDCFGFKIPDEPIVSPSELYDAIPEIDWMQGHSGVVLDNDASERLSALLIDKIEDFTFLPSPEYEDYEEDWFEASERIPDLIDRFSEYNPTVHSKSDEGFDWLESDEERCRCLVIPNPVDREYDIEIETQGEFIMYFAGSHAHYDNDESGFRELIEDIEEILNNKRCAFSCKYEGWGWCGGMKELQPSVKDIKELLKEEEAYYVGMLAEYTEKDVVPDGILSMELRYFNPSLNETFSFRLDELTDKVDEYIRRQSEVKKSSAEI